MVCRAPDRNAVFMIEISERTAIRPSLYQVADDDTRRAVRATVVSPVVPPTGTVVATSAAIEEIMRLRAEHHAIAFRPSGDDECHAREP